MFSSGIAWIFMFSRGHFCWITISCPRQSEAFRAVVVLVHPVNSDEFQYGYLRKAEDFKTHLDTSLLYIFMLMEEILPQLIWSISRYFSGLFLHAKWCKISFINHGKNGTHKTKTNCNLFVLNRNKLRLRSG